jgi:hypothetical protein
MRVFGAPIVTNNLFDFQMKILCVVISALVLIVLIVLLVFFVP